MRLLSRTVRSSVLLLACLLLALLVPSTQAAADPALMPPPGPPQLTQEQMGWLTTEGNESEEAHYGVNPVGSLSCYEHPEFGGCRDRKKKTDGKFDTDSSMYFQGYLYGPDGRYLGISAPVPGYLEPQHLSLRDADGIVGCATSGDKIPFCSGGGIPSGGAKFDGQGNFVELRGGAPRVQGEVEHEFGISNPLADLADDAFSKACEWVGKFAGQLIVDSMTWWLRTDSIDLSYANTLSGKEPVQKLVGFVMVAGILSSAMAMMLSRRTQPAVEIMLGGIKYILISSLALVVLSGALHAGDDFAQKMVENGAEDFGPNLQKMFGFATLQNPAAVLLLGIIAAILAFVQWVMGFIRQAGIVVLYSLIFIAAAGQLTTWGRQWFPRIASACVALVLYKPIAAMIYTIGFKLIGTTESFTTLVTGIMVIALAVLALPSMMKFFSFLGMQVGGGAGALSVIAGGAAGGAGLAMSGAGMFGGGGGDGGGDSHASYMSATGPDGSGESDPSPGNTGGRSGGGGGSGGGGHSALDAGGSEAPDLASSPESMENPDAAGSALPTDISSVGPDLAGAEGASAAGGGAAAGGAAGAAATGGASLAIGAAVSAVGSAAAIPDKVGDHMSGDDTGPDMK